MEKTSHLLLKLGLILVLALPCLVLTGCLESNASKVGVADYAVRNAAAKSPSFGPKHWTALNLLGIMANNEAHYQDMKNVHQQKEYNRVLRNVEIKLQVSKNNREILEIQNKQMNAYKQAGDLEKYNQMKKAFEETLSEALEMQGQIGRDIAYLKSMK